MSAPYYSAVDQTQVSPSAVPSDAPAPARIVAVVLLTLLLLWPVAANRTPFLYPDTVAYLDNGHRIWTIIAKRVFHRPAVSAIERMSGELYSTTSPTNSEASRAAGKKSVITGSRSFYYGTFAWLCRMIGGWFSIAVAQAAWCALALALALRRFGIVKPAHQVAAGAALSLLSTLAIYSTIILPDVFAGLVTLAIFMIVAASRTMRLPEFLFWSVTLVFGIVAHKAFLLASVVTLVLSIIALDRRVAGRWSGFRICSALIAVSAVLTLIVSPIAAMVGLRIVDPPFLLARVVGDGTAGLVLERDCPRLHYVACNILPSLPMTENDFLWDIAGVSWQRVSPAQRLKINAEQNRLVFDAVTGFPATQAKRTATNIGRQLFDLDFDEFVEQPVVEGEMLKFGFLKELRAYNLSRIRQHDFPLGQLADLWTVVYCLSLIFLLVVLLVRRARSAVGGDVRAAVFVVMGSILASAMITGSLAGVYGRYQGRISWLALFLAIVVAGHLLGRTADRGLSACAVA